MDIAPARGSGRHQARGRGHPAPRGIASRARGAWIGRRSPAKPGSRSPPRIGPSGEPYASALTQRLAACGLGAAEIIPIDSLTAQKRMVEAGFGVALLPASSVDEELRTGTLRGLKFPAMRVTVPVALVHRRRAYLSAAARQLMAVLAAWPKNRRV